MVQGLTLAQLQSMGAKPVAAPAPVKTPSQTGGLTLEQLQAMGATPAATPAPQKDSFSPSGQSAKALPILSAGAKAFGNAVTSSEQTVGKIISAPRDVKVEAGVEKTLSDAQYNTEKSLTDQIAAYKAAGKDTTHLEQTLAGVRQNDISKQHGDVAENVPASQETPEQALGAVGGTAVDLLTAGTYGAAAEAAKTGELASKAAPSVASAVADTVTKPSSIATKIGNVAKGAGIGYTADVANNAQDNAQGSDILKPHAGTALGAAIPIVGETIGGIKNALKPNDVKNFDSVVEATRDPVESKKQVIGAKKSGRGITSGPLNTKSIPPSEADITRAHNVAPFFDPKTDADGNIANMKAGITNVSESKIKPLVADTPNNVHYSDVQKYVTANTNDPKRIMGLFDGKSIINNNDILEARQKLDNLIQKDYGETAFGTPARTAAKENAIADRHAMNTMLENNIATGGNLEGLNRTNELASVATKRGINVDSAARADIEKYHGVQRTPENALRAIQMRQYLHQQTNLYQAVENLTRSSAKENGTNALGRFLRRNPTLKKVASKLPVVGAGLGAAEILAK